MADPKRPVWAERLQSEREARAWNKHEMARQLLHAAGHVHGSVESLARQILDWEKGRHFPRDWADSYARTFGLDKECLFFEEGSALSPSKDDEMQRRRLLQALATLGVAPTPVIEALSTVRDSLDLTLGRSESAQLAEWEEVVVEHGYNYELVPPNRLLPDLVGDVVAVQQIMLRKTGAQAGVKDWSRIIGGLAMLLAKTLCNLGQYRQARPWWVTAQHAADRSQDVDLSLWVSGEQVLHGIYEGRPIPILLRKASEVAERSQTRPSPGLAHVSTAIAQLHARQEQAEPALTALQQTNEIFEDLPSTVTNNLRSVHGWGEDRVRYTEAWVNAHLGEREGLDRAVARAHEILPASSPRAHTQLNLLQAAGYVRSGDITEGIRYASSIYDNHPIEQRSTMVTSLASAVLEAVPSQRRRDPAVSAYRELISSGDERKAIT